MKRPGRRTKLLSQVGALVAVLFALGIRVNSRKGGEKERREGL